MTCVVYNSLNTNSISASDLAVEQILPFDRRTQRSRCEGNSNSNKQRRLFQNLQWSQAEDWCVFVLVLTLVSCLKARLSAKVEFFEAVGRGSKIQYFFQLSLLATTNQD